MNSGEILVTLLMVVLQDVICWVVPPMTWAEGIASSLYDLKSRYCQVMSVDALHLEHQPTAILAPTYKQDRRVCGISLECQLSAVCRYVAAHAGVCST